MCGRIIITGRRDGRKTLASPYALGGILKER
jgi:hypothetical protein